MTKKVLFEILVAVFCVQLIAVQAQTGGMTSTGKPADDRRIPLSSVLADLGRRYGYFFTIEEAFKESDPMNRIESRLIEQPARGRKIQDELAGLSQQEPRLKYTIDSANPKIVHVIDGNLEQQKGYALENVVRDMDFNGRLIELVDAIAKRGIPVSSRGTYEAHDLLFADFKTQVHVKGKSMSVRQALSDFTPLEGRTSRILWIATTKLAPRATTYVRFV